MTAPEPEEPIAAPPVNDVTPEQADPYGGHEFHYEPHTDLFRCIKCHVYEVTARTENGQVNPCTGHAPAGAEPIEVNAW